MDAKEPSVWALRLCPCPERPDSHVFADPAGHPFCLGLGLESWPWGPAQVVAYQRWLAEYEAGE